MTARKKWYRVNDGVVNVYKDSLIGMSMALIVPPRIPLTEEVVCKESPAVEVSPDSWL